MIIMNIPELSNLNPAIFLGLLQVESLPQLAFNMFKTGSEARCTDASVINSQVADADHGWWLITSSKPTGHDHKYYLVRIDS